jgi:hypothetical protein
MLAHGFTVDFLVDHPHWDGDYSGRARHRKWTRDGSRPREDHGGWAASTRRASMALILRRPSASRASGEWSDDDFDVVAKGGGGS